MNFLYKIIFVILIIFILKCFAWYSCRDDVCFYSNGTETSSLTEAQDSCKKNGSKLLELHHQTLSDIFAEMITSLLYTNRYIWLNTRALNSQWQWLNGQPFNVLTNDNASEIFALVTCNYGNKEIIFSGGSSRLKEYFICSLEGCRNESCIYFETRNKERWFDARNECDKLGGDLAVLNWITNYIEELPTLCQNADSNFWIGLSNRQYVWEDSQISMKYNNWNEGQPTLNGDCAVIYRDINSKWVSTSCTDVDHLVVCMTETIVIQLNSTTSKSFEVQSSSVMRDPSATTKPVPVNNDKVSSSQSLAIGLGVGIPLAILSIIGIIIGVYFGLKKSNSTDESKVKNSSNVTNENTSEYETINHELASSEQQIYTSLSNI